MITDRHSGPDGFSVIYYEEFKDILFSMHANYLSDGTVLSPQLETRLAYISLIHKQANEPADFRQISLLNMDIKLYTKVLVLRFTQLFSNLTNTN